jgi:hypothetical protein
MKRGERKRLLRQATRARIRAERDALSQYFSDGHVRPCRIEEDGMLVITKEWDVPSVFAFAEKLNPRYDRPLWASQRYGAK